MSLLGRLYLGLVAAFLLAPLVVVAGVSLNPQRRLLFPPDGLSLTWYAALVEDAAWLRAMGNSLVIALLSAALAVAIALPLAWFLWRWRVRWARPLFTLGLAPFLLPPVITALGFLVFWIEVGLHGRMLATVVSHALFFVALPLANLSLGFESIDREVVEAGRVLGADEPTLFRTIVLPAITPYLVAGFAFAFVLSLNEYIVAYMVAGFTVETLPIRIFNSLRYGYTPVMAVVSVVFVLLAGLVFALVARYGDLLKLLGAVRPQRD